MAASKTDDLATLAVLDETTLLEVLRSRYADDHIYTYIGDILISINPFKQLPLYEKTMSQRYTNQQKSTLEPHIFAIADAAYRSMLGRAAAKSCNQCIVISGESGAGKTESTKLLLRHIMELCRGNTQLEQQVLQVNPLLEAFGNAQTLMNDNSSRFGKYIQLRFQNGAVKGAKINEYLLEKSRVVHQDTGERNFHIFYYMFAGLSKKDKEMYGLLEPRLYRYLSFQSIEDGLSKSLSTKFSELCNAMDMVGFLEQEQVDMLTILAGILSLGNVVFEPQDSGSMAITGQANHWLNAAMSQLGVDGEKLRQCLLFSRSVTRGESIYRHYTKQQAEDARDSIVKATYARVFGWIVVKINQLLEPRTALGIAETLPEIGILDIFGFEHFKVNRYEQLCINLANEQLQFFFNEFIFSMELNEYKKEGIECHAVAFKDNKPLLDLFLGKPIGIMTLLDEESHFPRGTDKTFVDKLNQSFGKNQHYELVRTSDTMFAVNHYAGKVAYSASGFLEKNRDSLPSEIRELFVHSQIPLLSQIFAGTVSRTGTLMLRRGAQANVDVNANSRKSTVGFQFRQSLSVLMEKMSSSNPHFIRCVKPNDSKAANRFDMDMVKNQLRCNGLLETTRIRKDGFSWRPSFEEFVSRYGILILQSSLPPNKESCNMILKKAGLEAWQIGKTKVFFKYRHQEELANLLNELQRAATVLQKGVRCFLARRRYTRILGAYREKIKKEQQQEEEERKRLEELERKRLQEQESQNKQNGTAVPETVPPVPRPRKKRAPSASNAEETEAPVPRPRSRFITVHSLSQVIDHEDPAGDVRSAAQIPPLQPSAPVLPSPLPSAAHEGQPGGAAINRTKTLQKQQTYKWFSETQAQRVLHNGSMPTWFHGVISRRNAEDLLSQKQLGCYLVRVSETQNGYALTFKGADRCRHYMIVQRPTGKYMIVGEQRVHNSLAALLDYHQTVGIQPYGETITEPCGQECENNTDYAELMQFVSKAAKDDGSPRHPKQHQQHLSSSSSLLGKLPEETSSSVQKHHPQVRFMISEAPGTSPLLPTALPGAAAAAAAAPSRTTELTPDEGTGGRLYPRLYPSIRRALHELTSQPISGPDEVPPLPPKTYLQGPQPTQVAMVPAIPSRDPLTPPFFERPLSVFTQASAGHWQLPSPVIPSHSAGYQQRSSSGRPQILTSFSFDSTDQHRRGAPAANFNPTVVASPNIEAKVVRANRPPMPLPREDARDQIDGDYAGLPDEYHRPPPCAPGF